VQKRSKALGDGTKRAPRFSSLLLALIDPLPPPPLAATWPTTRCVAC